MVEGRIYKPVIQPERCHSCDVCLRGCPAELIPEYRSEQRSLRGALYREKVQEKPSKNKIPLPPCQEACPIRQDVKGYVALIARGNVREALELIREVNPLPAVCGFICHHPCEEACLRKGVDDPISIRLLKRFVAQYGDRAERMKKGPKKKKHEKILVIGSGPAGLTAANDLCLRGYAVTIFEALPLLGGMLAVGIPEFRLPRETLRWEIQAIRERGVEMSPNHPFYFNGKETTFQKLGFDAVFLAIGAHRSVRFNIEGNHLEGVVPGLEFLRRIHLGGKPSLGERVVVVGGGNVAVDVSRSARRWGAKEVQMACVESRQEMPAIPEEVDEAVAEGIKIHFLASPVRVVGKGRKVAGIEFMRMSHEGMRGTKKKHPVRAKAGFFRLDADTVIAAIGQRVDRRALKGLETHPDGTLRVHPETGETSLKGVFAGGDVVTGPGWAIDAIASGKRGAEAIDQYLS